MKGILIPLKLFSPQFPFFTFFPFSVIESPCQSNNIPFYPFRTPHSESSVAPFLVNKSAYLPLSSCMYLITNNFDGILLVKPLREHCPEFFVARYRFRASVQQRKRSLSIQYFAIFRFAFPFIEVSGLNS